MRNRLWALGAGLVACAALYMTWGAAGPWDFILPYRGAKLAALLLVAAAVSTSTVLFQTVTQNRILTPSIMGFDALYILILTVSVFALGGGGYNLLPPTALFALNTGLMILAALALFGTLLRRARNDLMRLILTGIVFLTFFRSLTALLQRVMDPNAFTILQTGSYARFTRIETGLLALAALLTGLALWAAWRMRHRLDVLALGHDMAVNLGIDPRRGQVQALVLVAVLVAVSTALVGPVVFLGLLVVSIARHLTPAPYHAVLLPSAALVGGMTLIGGQALMERVMGLATPVSVVIDLTGGALFLFLLLKRKRP